MAKIVVGVDASPGALRALAWAADEARMRLASLQVVHAYQAQALAAPLYFPSQEALPGGAVAELSADADLLVVGSRGRAGSPACCWGRSVTRPCSTPCARWW